MQRKRGLAEFWARLTIVMGWVAAAFLSGSAVAAELTTIASFNFDNGSGPASGLVADTAGNLFGITSGGGANCSGVGGCGTVFELAKTARGYAGPPAALVNFCALPKCADGRNPAASLITDADGNLFGTTADGGAYNAGTVFEIARTDHGYAHSPTILVDFRMSDGERPQASLIADADGNLFGTTMRGGSSCPQSGGCGTVFEIVKEAGGYAKTPITLVSFCALADCADGAGPQASLAIDAEGNLFGTTYSGGAHHHGTVFEIIKTGGAYARIPATLVSFDGMNGRNPCAGLIVDTEGNLFGTTCYGGTYDLGTVFEIAKTATGYGTSPITLISFNGANGAVPAANLITDAARNLFGTTLWGGSSTNCAPLQSNGCGAVFMIVKAEGGYAPAPITLASFDLANGAYPRGGLTADSEGNLFGTAEKGGAYCPYAGCGAVFELTGTGFVAATRP